MSDDRREALESAYDKMFEADTEPAPAPAPVVETETAEPVEAAAPTEPAPQRTRARDEAGRFAPAEKSTEHTETKPVPPASPKAPQSWKAAARELVSKLPAEFHPLLEEAHRREKEISVALQKAAEGAKAHQSFEAATRPYEALIRQSGVPADQYVGSLLRAAHGLSYGAAEQRASVLADVVMQFASDLIRPDQQGADGTATSALERALLQRLGHGQAPARQEPAYRDPRVDQLVSALEGARARQAQQAQAAAESRAAAFGADHEFLADVKDEVADLVELWERRGQTVGDKELERAYDIACRQNPEIRAILERREAAKAVGAKAGTVQAARTAGSSVRSSPTAATAAQPTDRRAVLEAAFDALQR